MKFALALTLSTVFLTSEVFASYTPKYQVEFDADNIVSLIVENDSDRNLDCSYSVSWFENVLTFKKFFGKFSMIPGEVFVVTKKNDPHSRLSRLNGKISCN